MDALKTLLTTLTSVVRDCFPSFTGYANVVGEMSATSVIPASLFTRVIWVKENPDKKYTNTETQQYEVIDIYIRYSLDWKTDKYLTVSIPDQSGSG